MKYKSKQNIRHKPLNTPSKAIKEFFYKKMPFFLQNIWWNKKNAVSLHSLKRNSNTASVAQLVRAPDC
ncbi:hypothetical protein [Prevotella disiens]|uniref:hypothetical protein n=1 Tax=Prevotella disiens TaxID=28130 RepID=UPI00242A5671|nr:hypothetical protein [Prevotella disiens]